MTKNESKMAGKCPITFALEIFGDKWSLLLLRDIVFKGKKSYGEFLTSDEKISTNILASRLLKLESEGLVSKAQDTQNLSKYIYQLTTKGKDLIPLLLDMVEWSEKYNPQPNTPSCVIKGAPENLLIRLHKERESLINEIISNLEKHS